MTTSEIITAKSIETHPESLTIVLADRQISIPWDRTSNRLKNASASERNHAILSPGGYGIHWPDLDEDLSISGLVRSFGPVKGS
ncbi:MAG: DUF2442 domain-containing protein [Candidatus Sumerlaeia bacterium]